MPNKIKSKLIRMDYICNVCEIYVTLVKGTARADALCIRASDAQLSQYTTRCQGWDECLWIWNMCGHMCICIRQWMFMHRSTMVKIQFWGHLVTRIPVLSHVLPPALSLLIYFVFMHHFQPDYLVRNCGEVFGVCSGQLHPSNSKMNCVPEESLVVSVTALSYTVRAFLACEQIKCELLHRKHSWLKLLLRPLNMLQLW